MRHFKVFDSHFHIIDKRFPLVANQGFLPEAFTCDDYFEKTDHFELAGGLSSRDPFRPLTKPTWLPRLNGWGLNL